MIRATYVTNLLSGGHREISVRYQRGLRPVQLLPPGFRLGWGVVELDGRPLSGRELYSRLLEDRSSLVFADVPLGDDFQEIITFSQDIQTGDVFIDKEEPFIIAPAPTSDLAGDGGESPTLGFSGAQNTVGGGIPIPIIYGEVRSPGHIIESFTDVHFDQVDTSDPEITVIQETELKEEGARRLNTRILHSWGPVESISALEIDDNPIENIKGVSYEIHTGTKEQRAPDGFAESKVQTTIQTDVTVAGGAVSKNTVNTEGANVDVDTVEVALNFVEGLYDFDAQSNLVERSVDVKFSYQKGGVGATVDFATVTITRATRAPEIVWVRLPRLERGWYEITVTRITADRVPASEPNARDEFRWEFLTLVLGSSRALPGFANTGLRHLPQENTAVPRKYTFLVKGKNNIRVYSDLLTYTEEWTNNPAWIFAHFVTDPINGLGKFYSYSDLPIAQLIAWAQANQESAPSGRGSGREPRNHFDFSLDSQISTQEFLELVQIAGEAILTEEGGKWAVELDRPVEPVLTLGEADYERDSLEYIPIDREERPTRISVNFLNAERNYVRDTVIVEDETITQAEHFVDSSINAWGITRPSQALRLGRKLILKNRLEDVEVSFTGYLRSLALRPGRRFRLQSTTALAGVASGRVMHVSADELTLRLDQEFSADATKSYEILIVHQYDCVESLKAVTGVDTMTTNIVTVENASWNRQIQVGDEYFLGEVGSEFEDFRVQTMSIGDNLRVQVRARKYDPDVYVDSVLGNVTTTANTIFNPLKIPGVVSNLSASEREPEDSAANTIKVLDVGWTVTASDEIVSSYEILFKESGGNLWRKSGTTSGTSWVIPRVKASTTYDVAVVAVSPGGRKLAPEDSTQTTATTTA